MPTKMGYLKWEQTKWGYIFISPWLIGFLLFYLLPMIASLVFSLYNFELATPEDIKFIGFANWQRLLFNDPAVWSSLGVTFVFAIISLPIGLISAISLAVLLNSEELLGKNIFRTLFYAPTMIPLIAAILIWNGVLNPQVGWINRFLDLFGIQASGANGLLWFDDPQLVYIAYTYISLWGIGNTMLITLAALQGVPTSLYDAAKIDGAGWWSRLFNITLPMITPVLFYNLVLSVVGVMQYFIVPWVMTGGNGHPDGATRFYMIYFYKQAFAFQSMGYGATLAWFIFLISLGVTLILFRTSKSWVYYAGE